MSEPGLTRFKTPGESILSCLCHRETNPFKVTFQDPDFKVGIRFGFMAQEFLTKGSKHKVPG